MNMPVTPVIERIRCHHGRAVRTTLRGPTVWNDSANSGTSAKNARKKITSPTGTAPTSLIATYMNENARLAEKLQRDAAIARGASPQSLFLPRLNQKYGTTADTIISDSEKKIAIGQSSSGKYLSSCPRPRPAASAAGTPSPPPT